MLDYRRHYFGDDGKGVFEASVFVGYHLGVVFPK
jgi:hypothetical protein